MKTRLYRTAKTFKGENFCELIKNMIFAKKTLADYPLLPYEGCYGPNFTEKTFVNSHKTAKFTKVPYMYTFTHLVSLVLFPDP